MNNVTRKNKRWYPLDVAAKIFPTLESADNPNTFRVVMHLKEDLDKDVLQEALNNVLPRFPYYSVSLKKGFFWYYLEENNQEFRVWPDSNQPSDRLNPRLNNGYLFRVKYYKKNLIAEFFHVLTDGGGALEFLKTLGHQYLYLQGKVPEEVKGVFSINSKVMKEEAEDAFLTAYNNIEKNKVKKERMLFNSSKSYQFKDRNVPFGETMVITGSVSMDDMKRICTPYDVTVTQFIVGLYIEAAMKLQDIQVKNKKFHKRVAISVPVNLRKYHRLPCMRNFTMFIVPSVHPNETRDFDLIINKVKTYMQEQLTQESIDRMIVDNSNLVLNKFISSVPLFFKNLIVKFVSKTMTRSQFTSGFSNVGLMRLPEEMAEHIEDFTVMVGPARSKKRACTAIGYNGKLNISFTRNVPDAFIERHVFRRLVELGVKVSISSNKGEL